MTSNEDGEKAITALNGSRSADARSMSMKRAPRQNAVAAVVVAAGEIVEIAAAGAAAADGAIVTSNKFHIQI